MKENESLTRVNENFFTRILNKIKIIFKIKKEEVYEETIEENLKATINKKFDNKEHKEQKREFLENIKVNENEGIIYLKIKLENNEIRAIDLTDEQIEELQKIYDKEIQEKKNIIRKLKENN